MKLKNIGLAVLFATFVFAPLVACGGASQSTLKAAPTAPNPTASISTPGPSGVPALSPSGTITMAGELAITGKTVYTGH
jgi:hypothetical protein